jgi:hypothetical protein
MKCAALTLDGRPCPANATRDSNPPTCPMHGDNALSYQRRGAIASRMRRALPADYKVPAFEDRAAVIRFAQDLAQRVLTEEVDPRRVDSALRAAGVALTGFAAATQEKLVEALLKIEHGGVAFAWLSRIQEGLENAAPLPSRLRAIRAPAGDVS